ncbi:MAG: CPBP family intramembrane metalloprotease [Chloroflexota bacterium]|nr:MAG: CPBP family intramembrane metalloprotease [Chloroflexota bacterium]
MANWLNGAIPMEPLSIPTNQQHSIARSVVLHLLPGALITAFYIGVAPMVRELGFPSLMALYLAIVVVLIPFELGLLFYRARKEAASLGRVVLYREPVPRGQLVGLVLVTFTWASLIAMVLFPPLDEFFTDTFFFWLPDWFFMAEDFARYSAAALLITWVVGLLANGIAGPVVEELYFRGYLLPRISWLGGWAPALNMVLFSLYHFFTPWATVGRIVALLPMVSATWWSRNIYLGIAVHVLWNIGGMLLLLAILLGSGGSGP